MGRKISTNYNKGSVVVISWDWLMPVVQKIAGLGLQTKVMRENERYMNVIGLSIAVQMGLLYTEVVEFIKWYSTKSPNQQQH